MPKVHVRRLLVAVALLTVALPPRLAWAIPSPEVILSTASGLGWLFAGLLGLAGVTAGLPRGARRGWATAAMGLVATALVIAALLVTQRLALEAEAGRIEHEFRCDIGYHQQRNEANADWRPLVEGGHIQYQAPSAFGALAAAPGAHVVAVDLRLPLWVAAGHLAAPPVQVVGAQTHLAEFDPTLRAGLAEATHRGLPARLLLSVQRPNPLMYFDPQTRASLAATLAQYAEVHVFVVGEFAAGHPAYVGATWLLGDPAQHGQAEEILQADPSSARSWPVLPEGLLVDAAAVWRPAFDRVLSTRQLARALDDPDVVVVAPFAAFYRDRETYLEEFVAPLLPDVPSARVVAIDYSAPDVRAALAQLGARLQGRPWVIVGVSKFDTVHYGLDVLHATGDAHAGFVGWSSDLGAAAALRAVGVEARRAALPAWLARPVVETFARAGAAALSHPGLWLGWGILGALCLLPAGIRIERQTQLLRWLDRQVLAAEARNHRVLLATQPSLVRAAGSRATTWLALLAVLVGGLFVLAVASVVPAWTGLSMGRAPWPLAAALAVVGAIDPGRVDSVGMSQRARAWSLRAGRALLFAVLPWLLPAAVGWALLGAMLVRALTSVVMAHRMRRSPTAPAAQADKAGRLAAAAAVLAPAAVSVPRSVALGPNDVPPRWTRHGTLAVRSSAAGEDGLTQSLAGAYRTMLNVQPAALDQTIAQVRADYPAAGGRVLVQRMVPARLAMTVFSQDPASDAFVCVETSAAVDGRLVQGTASDVQTWRLSRLSGRWTPQPWGQIAHWLDQAAAIALLLETRWSVAVDLELLVAAPSDRVVLLQARPATVAAARAPIDAAAYAALHEVAGGQALVPSPWRDQCHQLSRPMFAVLEALTAPDGAVVAGWAQLGFAVEGGRPVVWDGALYATPTTTRSAPMRRPRTDAGAYEARLAALVAAAAALDTAAPGPWRDERRVFGEAFALVVATTAWTDLVRRGARGAVPARPAAAAWGSPSSRWLASDARDPAWAHRAEVDLDVGVPRAGEQGGVPIWPVPIAPWTTAAAPLGAAGPRDVGGWNWEVALDWLRDVSHDLGARAVARLRSALATQNGRALAAGDSLCVRTGTITAGTSPAGVPLGARSWTWEDLDARLREGLPIFLVGTGPIAGVPVTASDVRAGKPVPAGAWVLVSASMTPHDVALAQGAAGWVVASGNALSHAAIVARERGLPVVVLDTARWERVSQAAHVRIAGEDGQLVVQTDVPTSH